MAHVRGIKHIVNAIGNQQRLIVHLDCGHNMSVSSRQIADSGLGLEYHLTADQAICPFCPDPPPPTPEDARRAKTANRLWKEVGEP